VAARPAHIPRRAGGRPAARSVAWLPDCQGGTGVSGPRMIRAKSPDTNDRSEGGRVPGAEARFCLQRADLSRLDRIIATIIRVSVLPSIYSRRFDEHDLPDGVQINAPMHHASTETHHDALASLPNCIARLTGGGRNALARSLRGRRASMLARCPISSQRRRRPRWRRKIAPLPGRRRNAGASRSRDRSRQDDHQRVQLGRRFP
jgi:hypothetical protein